ncbi:GAF domain-containing protein [Desulforegula conservatrix]|uniref:GAF domain-containing protein n=1 Tax=Desulforegula conservatrix TaxID=153026 RepID=UPI000421A4B1|nr:GAF domain-containing protein [Desulforegula conservatrix]
MTERAQRITLREFKAISSAISSYEDINLLGRHLVEGICRAFRVKGCSIFLVDDREKQLFRVSTYGLSEHYLTKGPMQIDEASIEFSMGEPVYIEDTQNDPRIKYAKEAKEEGIHSMLSVPIKSKSIVVGLLKIYNDTALNLHDEDLDSFRVLAKQVGVVIENNGLRNFLDRIKMALESLPLRMLDGLNGEYD